MSLADVHISLERAALVAQLSGEIDMSNAEELGATVIGSIPTEARGVVLDLSSVEYMDSAGIYVIHNLRSSLQARGQALILVIPERSPVRDALRLTGTDRPGETTEALAEAVQALESPASGA